jgi:formate/nitrite transporter FocA (FNT family)
MLEIHEQKTKSSEELSRRLKAEERRSISAAVVHEAILQEGRAESKRTSSALAWSGLAAGLSMGFSLAAEGALKAVLPDTKWAHALTNLGYPIGFLFVILGRQQLYTESTLVAALPALHDRTRGAVLNMFRLWGIVLVMNIVGVFIFAWGSANTEMFTSEMRHAFSTIGHESIRNSFGADLVKGILGGWLVALMAWLLPASRSARFWVIIVTTYVLAISELTHVIAGSSETLYIVATGEITFLTYLGGYFLPVLIGNTIGGFVLVAALNHAQVAADEP